MAETVLYAAYGDMGTVLHELFGREVGLGRSVMLKGVELCVQQLVEVPDIIRADAPAPISARTMLAENWDETFKAYAVRKTGDQTSQVPARVYEISPEERTIILEEWNLSEFGWFHDLSVQAQPLSGSPFEVVTDVIDAEQAATPVSHNGYAVQLSLNGQKSTMAARAVRQNYLDRLVG